ncbi:MAG TPA: TonB-dependent receptor [Candidatus Aminicenantes bacterium]|nr:TonB-dependent receptor [Candidatus Aminicenantes bacterium]
MKRTLALIAGVFLLESAVFSGQDPEKASPPLQHDVVVTAARIETPAREVATSVTVISRSDLEAAQKTTVLEALKDLMGGSVVQSGGLGSAASLMLRGANSEHTLVLLDGVELNDPITPSRSYDLAHLDLDQVERIEVLRGPQSTLFGSDALGGVVNIITRKGEGRPKASLSLSSGSMNTSTGRLGVAGSSGRASYSLGLAVIGSDGISAANSALPGNSERDGYKNLSFSSRLGYEPAKNLQVNLTTRYLRTRTDLDNFGGPYGDDPNSSQRYDSLFVKGEARGRFLNNRLESKLGLAFIRSDRRNDNPVDESHPYDLDKGSYQSTMAKLDWQNSLVLHASNTLTFGVEFEREAGKSEYESAGIWGPSLNVFPRQKTSGVGIYIQDQVRLAGSLFAAVGIRLDGHSRSGNALTYRIAPAYFIKETGTRFRLTLGTGFKSPSLYQLYAPPTAWGPIGNMQLKPEESIGWDAGIDQEWASGRLKAGATYFFNRFKNLVNFDFVHGYVNVGRAETSGLEISGEAKPADHVALRASYTRLKAKDRDTGLDLLRRPKDKITAGLTARLFEKFNFHLGLVYSGRRDDLDFSSWTSARVTLPGYTLIDAALSFPISSKIEAYVRLDNILNRHYELIYGYGTPGFCACGGFKLNL